MDARPSPPVIDAVVLDGSAALPNLDGLRRRRCFAWAIDVAICSVLFWIAAIPAFLVGVFTFGLLWGPAWIAVALVPLVYHAALVSGARGATWGQRLAGIEFVGALGGRASFLQAGIHWVLFYMGFVFTFGLIVLWSLFNPKKALLHDQIAGLVACRAPARVVR